MISLDYAKEMSNKGNLKVAAGAVVCQEAEIEGDVTIGARTVIHPKARVIAEGGPIIIGDNNLIEEHVSIVNRAFGSGNQTVLIIGNNNVFEVGAHSEAVKIGDHNVLESKCHVGRQTQLSNGCIIGTMCMINTHEILPQNTVIYGSECERRVQCEHPAPQTLQLDFLSKILPNYHHLKKSSKQAK